MSEPRQQPPTGLVLIAGTYAPERCGVAHYTARLREELLHRGLDSRVVTDREAPAAPGVHAVVPGWGHADLPALVGAIRRARPQLLHIQHAAGTYGFRRGLFWLPLLLRASGWRGPIVTTVHEYGNWEWHPPAPWRPLLRSLTRWGERRGWWEREDLSLLTLSDVIIATHPETEQLLRTRVPALAPRLHLIPIGSNIDCAPVAVMEARARLRRRYGWPLSAPVVAFFGFLHPVKGLETLLRAFARAVERVPEARLLLIGGVESLALRGGQAQEYWRKLLALVEELALGRRVHLTGYLEGHAASELLWGCDVGALPFNYGLNLKSGSLLALMAHDLPVVATRRNPPLPEFERTELVRLVEPRDIGALAEALLDLLGDETLRARLAASGRHFLARFSWPTIAERHLALYRAVGREHPSLRHRLHR